MLSIRFLDHDQLLIVVQSPLDRITFFSFSDVDLNHQLLDPPDGGCQTSLGMEAKGHERGEGDRWCGGRVGVLYVRR